MSANDVNDGDDTSPSASPRVAAAQAAASKKKPGRPRKKPLKSAMERAGVAAAPKRDDNCVELVYDEPMIFKRVFSIFKAADADQLNFVFDANEMRIFASDHMQKSDILVTFDCKRMTHYYCNGFVAMTLGAPHLERINQMLDKSHTHVTIIVKKSSIRSAITLIFQNAMKIDEIREIKADPPGSYKFQPDHFNSVHHAISFELPSKFLKKFVSDISILSDRLTIRKVGAAGPLTFLYTTDDNKVDAKHIVKDSEAIKLVVGSEMGGDTIFSTTVMLDYIKPFAASLLAETARIYVDSAKKMLFVSELDNKSIIIKVTAEIERMGV